ncbi:unnamed protein product [Blepharisma stoltei]|uniref:Uncharacterized protein n=1 Tax=Blepharisma stoltei TaxID=1481888 RepID=A0AAU9IRS4_9CILI|nr:unnamed protein product [Blepharisma stoltei]
MNCSLQIPFIFWNKKGQELTHNFSSLACHDNLICTGSETGDICIWRPSSNQYSPEIICTIGIESVCRALEFIKAPCPELIGSTIWLISLHQDNRLRCWDLNDGRCMSISESAILPEHVMLNKMLKIQDRFVAISGESSDIYFIDTWAMERIAYFSMPGEVVYIETAYFSNNLNLLSLDATGELDVWTIPDLKDYYYDRDNLPQINPDPWQNFQLKEEMPSLMKSSSDAGLLAVVYEYYVWFIHYSWFDLPFPHEAILDVNSKIIDAKLDCEFFYVLLDNGEVYKYDVDEILNTIEVTKINTKFSGQPLTKKTYQFELDHISIDAKIPVTLTKFFKDDIISVHNSKIFITNVLDEEKYTLQNISEFSTKKHDIYCYADYSFETYLKPGEEITVSALVAYEYLPFYIIGTTLGRILVTPTTLGHSIFIYSYHKSPITCVYLNREKFISCSSDNVLCLWNFRAYVKAIDRNTVITEPLQTLNVWCSPVKTLIPVSCLKETMAAGNEEGLKFSKERWEQTLLAQCEDGSILLITLANKASLCYFQALSSRIKEAEVHVGLEYLLVKCDDGYIYLFNMIMQALERIISKDEAHKIFRKSKRQATLHISYESTDLGLSQYHQIIHYNLRQNYVSKYSDPFVIRNIWIGGREYQVLFLNIESIEKRVEKKLIALPYMEYVMGLLGYWNEEFATQIKIVENLKSLMKLSEPRVCAGIGAIGLNHALSFTLPKEKSNYEISGYLSAQLMTANLSLLVALSSIEVNLKAAIKKIAESYMRNYKFKFPDLTFFILHSLSDNRPSKHLQDFFMKILDPDTKKSCFEVLLSVFLSKPVKCRSPSKKLSSVPNINCFMPQKEQRTYIPFVESLIVTYLGYISINSDHINSETTDKLVTVYRCMLKTGMQGNITIAAELLGKGMQQWKQDLVENKLEDIINELLTHSCSPDPLIKKTLYKAILRLASCEIQVFLDCIYNGTKKSSDKIYSANCLSALSTFIEKRYDEISMVLPNVMNVLLACLDPSTSGIRKNCIEKAVDCLQKLVISLPMVAYNQEKQKFAIGTVESSIMIYDLKTATKTKELFGHDSSISALEFNPSGSTLASYSYQDFSIRIWKLDGGFLGFMGGEIRANRIIILPEIDPVVVTYREFLDTITLSWTEDGKNVHLMRENAKHYTFSLN